MTSLTHAAIGGYIGKYIPNPILAFVAGVISHLVADKVPHFWPKSRKARGVIIALDTVFSALFIAYLYIVTPRIRVESVVAGAIGGVSVDFFFILIMRTKGRLAEWHTNRQHHMTQLIWVFSDILLFAAALILFWVTKW